MDGHALPGRLPELSNFYCLPGRAGGSPLAISERPTAADASAACPRCSAPLRRRTTLELASVGGEVPLAGLGIPPREILAVRTAGKLEFVELADVGGDDGVSARSRDESKVRAGKATG